MNPEDPRHGTVYGYNTARCRCTICATAHRRRCKQYRARRHNQGADSTLIDATRPAAVLAEAAEQMSLSAIGRYLGTSHTWVAKVIRGDIKRISPQRALDVYTLPTHKPDDTSHVNALGTQRRLQALHAMGYTWQRLSDETSYNLTSIKATAKGQWPVIEARNAASVRDAYDRLCMTQPVGTTPHERGGIQAAKNVAARNGWPVPLAWTDIDNPAEQPRDWQYRPETRLEQFLELDASGAGVTEACGRLHIARPSLQKWAERNQLNAAYSRMVARETAIREHNNQHTKGAAA